MLVCDHIHFLLVLAGKEQTSLLDEMLVSLLLMLSGMFFSNDGEWLLCWWTYESLLLGFTYGL